MGKGGCRWKRVGKGGRGVSEGEKGWVGENVCIALPTYSC